MSGSPEIEALDSGKIDVSGCFDYQMYCAIWRDSTISSMFDWRLDDPKITTSPYIVVR
jgi:hypothetical protein